MAHLLEAPEWVDGIYQIETTDPVIGGPPNLALGQGISNVQAQQLAQRTSYLKGAVEGHVAVVGQPVADGGLIWSSDGTLMINATGDNLAPTGTNKADLLSAGFADFVTHFKAGLLAEATPAGAVAAFAFSTPPTGWLECDGAPVSRLLYADLFAAIGTTFGAGDGATTFDLPDLRGEFIRGWDHGRGVDPSRGLGSSQDSQNKAHTHNISRRNSASVGAGLANTTVANGAVNLIYAHFRYNGANTYVHPSDSDALHAASAGGSEARPRNVALMMCIKY